MVATRRSAAAKDGAPASPAPAAPADRGDAKRAPPRSAVRHIAWLDNLLTALFIGELVLCAFFLRAEYLKTVGIAVVATAIVTKSIVLFVQRVAPWFSRTLLSAPPMNDPLSKPLTLEKVAEQSWQLVVHTTLAALEWHALTGVAWYYDTTLLWVPIPWLQDLDPLIQMVYMVQLGVWIWTGFSCRFIEARRKDYYVMMTHHIATIFLVAGSLAHGYVRFGIITLFLHDISDVFIDLLKIFNYLKMEGPSGFFCVEMAYASTIVTWIYYRLYLFPFVYISSAIFESPCVFWNRDPNLEIPFLASENYNIMLSLVHVLVCLHIYWFWLFIKMGQRAFAKGGKGAHQSAAEHMEGDSD